MPVTSIAQGLAALREAERQVERAEEYLAKAKERVRLLEQVELPALFDEAETYEVELPNGLKGKQKLKVIGSLPKVDPKADHETQVAQARARDLAFDWLSQNGYGPLIKCTVMAEFDKTDRDAAIAMYTEMRAMTNSADVTLKEDIHPQTLGAQMRRRTEEGKDVPLDKLGLSVITVVELTKRPKETV